MEDKSTSVSYMTEYLKYALMFEKYVYIWHHALEESNECLNRVSGERQRLENTRESLGNSLENLDLKFDDQCRTKEQKAQKYKKQAKVALSVAVAAFILCMIVGCVGIKLGGISNNSAGVGIAVGAFIYLRTLVGPVCIGVGIFSLSKSKMYKNEVDNFDGAIQQQEILLRNNMGQAEKDLHAASEKEVILREKKEEISLSFLTAKKNLAGIYSENVLSEKYRNINAVAKMYEYLSTGQCDTIKGHGGIYDTYETERLQLIQINILMRIEDSLEQIKENQMKLYEAIQDVKMTLNGIHSTLESIENTTERIEENTAISATADQQTAAANQYMAWHAWYNS